MSVLVNGIKMPKNCDECMFHWHGDGTTYCLAQSRLHNLHHIKWPEVTTREAADVFREDTCPLVELPDKHGRLIDADALVATMDNALRMMKVMMKVIDAEDDPEMQMELKAYQDILNGIKEEPTIIEAEGQDDE